MSVQPLEAAYVFDADLTRSINESKQNNWEVYIREINEQLGLRATSLSLADLENADRLNRVKTLILGHQSGTRLNRNAREALDRWVKAGGTLIGFNVKGLDRVFGIESFSRMVQEPDDYAISGYFGLLPDPLTADIHPVLFYDQKLFALSDIELVVARDAAKLGSIFDGDGQDQGYAAVTWNHYGEGYAGYFAFDVAKTVWLLHQGRPLDDIVEGYYTPRTNQMQVLGPNSSKIPYADEILLLVQNMVAQSQHPFVYQIPPDGAVIPDAVLYWGGDEYTGPTQVSLDASDWMKEKGLPYHINIVAEMHPITPEEFQHIKDNGHEISSYVFEVENKRMRPDWFKRQSDSFLKRFGTRPITVVLDVLRWKGWAEPARWMAECGIKADNSFSSSVTDNALVRSDDEARHPLLNAPFYGFGFGTSYPFFFYDDFDHGNQRIDFIEEPIICYEIGHRGSLDDKESDAIGDIYLPIDTAVKYHMTMDMFYHPGYIAGFPRCREAIEEILAYIEKKKARVLHMGNDQLAEWWLARSEARIYDVEADGKKVSFKTVCGYASGMIVKQLIPRETTANVVCDGEDSEHQIRSEFGGNWLYTAVPQGEHVIGIGLK